ncbi:methyl-CpG-binding domain-containing protein 7-like isoform X4 [Mangifera indica]|uniref:methyl-CpG-binding domain-containing protein 7-like isoform X4 n=1 Tax=Mangifera indica TaxID=29780 RepID=UPI001CFC01A9|nr:methyl-CpG-binding domain-containing protein 7-like isoform X4 [Mangifera indica]
MDEEKSSPSSQFEQETSRGLQIVDSTTSSVFQLPPGWSVKECHRINSPSNPGRIDKYYYQPESGRRFRSLISIQKYLSRDTEDTIMPKRMKSDNKNYMQIVPFNTKSGSSYGLPDNWVVQERPRIRGRIIDKYYIETGTGLCLRSRIAVERYLAAGKEVPSTSNAKSDDQLTVCLMPSKNSSFEEKHSSDAAVNPSTLDFSSLPAKVKWVLGGPVGNMWNPFVGESVVPESVKQEWFETFVDSIQLQATDNGGA